MRESACRAGAEASSAGQARALFDAKRSRMEALMRIGIRSGDAPKIVASIMIKAALASSPKRRDLAGKQASQVRFLRRFLPETVAAKTLREMAGLPAQHLSGLKGSRPVAASPSYRVRRSSRRRWRSSVNRRTAMEAASTTPIMLPPASRNISKIW